MPTVNAGADTKVCMDDSVQLNATTTNAKYWVWNSLVALNDTTILNPKAKINKKSLFVISVSDSLKMCKASDTVEVDAYAKVKANYTADTYNGVETLKPIFTNTSQNASLYNWLFGDSLKSSSKDKNPDFTFIKPGKYKVTLIAKNDFGCADTFEREFTILPYGEIYVPNVFTPNGDSINDFFKLIYPEIAFSKVDLFIYNRWGGFLYETSMPGGRWWDGTFEGEPSPNGVYFYIAKAVRNSGEILDFHGTVTLLR